jgi:hypothetical protein
MAARVGPLGLAVPHEPQPGPILPNIGRYGTVSPTARS